MKLRPLAFASLLIGLTGCATLHIPAYDVVKPPASGAYIAGAAIADITPPPGYPLGGHSIGGRMAVGYWQRLHARTFYFEDAQGRRLALVSCDLFAIPAGLHNAVAEQLKYPPESLVVSATHTTRGRRVSCRPPSSISAARFPALTRRCTHTSATSWSRSSKPHTPMQPAILAKSASNSGADGRRTSSGIAPSMLLSKIHPPTRIR